LWFNFNRHGVPDNQDVGMDIDLNKDGVPDINQDASVKSAQTEDNQAQLGVSIQNCDDAVALERIAIIASSEIEDSAANEAKLPSELIGFVLIVKEPGQTARVDMLNSRQPLDGPVKWMRYDEIDGWQECADIAENPDNGAMQYQVKDGDASDADGAANGVIISMVGPKSAATQDDDSGSVGNDSDDSSSGSDNKAGCYMDTLLR
jgi:hypothetical protein